MSAFASLSEVYLMQLIQASNQIVRFRFQSDMSSGIRYCQFTLDFNIEIWCIPTHYIVYNI